MAVRGSEYSRRSCVYWPLDRGARVPELVGAEFACLSGLVDDVPVPTAFCVTALSPHDLLPAETDDLWSLLDAAHTRMQKITGEVEPRLVVRRGGGGPLPQVSDPPTILDAIGLDGLAEAVHEVLTWPAATRVTDPRLPPEALGGRGRSAVLVQALLPAEVSARVGLHRSASSTGRSGPDAPVPGRPDPDALIGVRAAWGLGEGLGDEETPADTYLFTENLRLIQQRIARKDRMTVFSDGAVLKAQVPARQRLVSCLDEQQARRVSALYQHVRQRLRHDVRMSVVSVAGDLVAVSCVPAG
ncbi:hypothetical protein AWW66_31180 [Micromonospora rosaria]|uniref:Pyruvate phosphate dikinase AMP/ATP-binding domain-containing protein n=1 Tax=Micromonospora rosaria TaxID=47874 RepID=A0A136PIG1_9ACTN|nr:PEP/pyruvate-binding domain-containing protein [Micromonospora rosaria]KXK58196.1 hypothetical protein AWW66_31180 [Micromonospora rosaria]